MCIWRNVLNESGGRLCFNTGEMSAETVLNNSSKYRIWYISPVLEWLVISYNRYYSWKHGSFGTCAFWTLLKSVTSYRTCGVKHVHEYGSSMPLFTPTYGIFSRWAGNLNIYKSNKMLKAIVTLRKNRIIVDRGDQIEMLRIIVQHLIH